MASAISKVAAVVMGTGGFASALYMTYQWQRMELQFQEQQQHRPANHSFVANPERNKQYEEVARCYDDTIGRDELVTGINLMRRFLLKYHARGNCLEVGAGTARNLDYYPMDKVTGIILADTSSGMLEQARPKISELMRKRNQRIAVVQADAESTGLPDNAFDTVIDTFGLCSYDHPVAVLNEMARVCKSNGKILLLEHGRSKTWEFMSNFLDRHAEQHAAHWGCVWNRDLEALVEQANLEIDTMHKFHFGTTYYMVCRPRKASAATTITP